MFWLLLFLFVGSTIASTLFQRHNELLASSLGDFTAPTAQVGRVIPVVFGTCKMAAPNVVWYGDLTVHPIKQSSGIIPIGPSTTVGYRYYIGMQMGICHGPVDDITALIAQDTKPVTYTRTTILNAGQEDYIRLVIDQTSLFGGDKQEGGLKGNIDFYRGLQTSRANAYLSQKLGLSFAPSYTGTGNGTMSNIASGVGATPEVISATATDSSHFTISGSITGAMGTAKVGYTFTSPQVNFLIRAGSTPFTPADVFTFTNAPAVNAAPAYNGICYAVAEQFYVGTSNYIKPLAFIVRRCPDPFSQGAGIANINGDANPALMIADAMMDISWGLGIPASRFGASWTATASTLATEGTGLSMQLDNPAAADQFIAEVSRHCDAAVYTDPATGLWEIKLARADYDPATLLVLDQTNIQQEPEFSRGSWENTINEVKLIFTDRSTFAHQAVQAQDTGNFAARGEKVSATFQYLGFSNSSVAQRMAIRELKTHSYPLAQVKLIANRVAWNLRIGGVFKWNWPAFGITGMVLRITSINYGSLEDGHIEVEAVEDIFSVAFTAFSTPLPTNWSNPYNQGASVAPAAQMLVEAPFSVLQAPDRRVIAMCVRGDGNSLGFQVWSDDAIGSPLYESTDVQNLTPSGLIRALYPRTTAALDGTGFTLVGGVDMIKLVSTDSAGVTRGDNLLLFGDTGEWCSWQTITDNGDGTYTFSGIARGIFDTLPVDHPAGTDVWFITDGSAMTRTAPYPADGTLSAKLLPYNAVGLCPIANVNTVTRTMASRAQKPFPPGRVQVNSLFWLATVVTDALLTWNNRIRTAQTSIVLQDAASVAGVVEGNYTIAVIVGGVTIRTLTGQTGNSFTYTALQRFLDSTDGTKAVQLTITPVNGTLQGTPRTTDPFTMTGFGMAFGNYFGGLNS